MASSTLAVSCAILVILVMCQPVQAQQQNGVGLGTFAASGGSKSNADGGASGSGTSRTDSAGRSAVTDGSGGRRLSGGIDAIVSALQGIGAEPRLINNIAAALPNDSSALRDLLVPRMLMSPSDGARQLRTPAQAAVAFNDVVNSAFRNASGDLARLIFRTSRGSNPPASPAGGSVRASDTFRNPGADPWSSGSFPGIVLGFATPLDSSVLNGANTAGTGLPPVTGATPADLQLFAMQLLGDLGRQGKNFGNQAAQYQLLANQKARVDKSLNEACVQYALSQFLNAFANLLMGLNLPAADVLGVLGQIAGMGYAGLSPIGASYLNAYCCNKVRTSGIDTNLGPGDSTLSFGGITIDLGGLLNAVPAIATGGIPAAAGTAQQQATSAVNSLLGGLGNVAGGAATAGPPTCNVLDWLAFALQGNRQLAKQFTQLITSVMRLQTRLFSQSLGGANKAAGKAADIVKQVGKTPGGAVAAAADPTLGALLDATRQQQQQQQQQQQPK